MIRRRTLDEIPGWLARIHGLSVPKRVVPHHEPSPIGGPNIKIILGLVNSVLHLDGDLAECGVYRGSTILALGLYLVRNNPQKKAFGFDSFEGFGDLTRPEFSEDSAILAHGTCTDTSFEMLRSRIRDLGLSDCVEIIKGYFNETLNQVESRKFCFSHLDCDIYESYRCCLQFFYPRMVPGGVILLDEYDDPPWPGCNKAVDEFLEGKPEAVTPVSSDNHIKYFIRKS